VRTANLCRFGHKSFAKDLPNPLNDENGHGTHISGLINQNAHSGDFCLVAIKYYSDAYSGVQNLANFRKAIQYALNIKVDFINFSGGGGALDLGEKATINKLLDRGTTIVVAAGNEQSDLDERCDFFPACDDKRLIVVGNMCELDDEDCAWTDSSHTMRRSPSSNFGAYVTRWEMGNNVESTLPGGRKGRMTGTSQAAAIATGKLIRERLDVR